MTRISIIIALAVIMAPSAHAALAYASPAETIQAEKAAAPDTVTAAKALVPLLDSVRQRLQPRVGVTGPGDPPPSPFTGRQSTVVSVGVGKRDAQVDPKVVKALHQLQEWKIGRDDQTAEAVLFDHWLGQLTVKAAMIGLVDCDASCVVSRFPKPDEAFGRSRNAREEMRDQLLLDALSAAVDELDPGR
jgi:hypothetical protein